MKGQNVEPRMNTDEHGCECASGAQTGMSVSLSQALLACCSDDECRWQLMKPGLVGFEGMGFIVATDERWMVLARGNFLEPLPLPDAGGERVQELERRESWEKTCRKLAVQAIGDFRDARMSTAWVTVPGVPAELLEKSESVCTECKGSGRVQECGRCEGKGDIECPSCGHWHRCDDCGGRGTWGVSAACGTGVECECCDEGKIQSAVPLNVWGNVWVDWRRVEKLRGLFGPVMFFQGPAAGIAKHGSKFWTSPLLFQAGEVFGVLMPYNYKKGENGTSDAVAMKLEEVSGSGFQVSSSKPETRNEKPETSCTGGAL
jgi:hypothetical protein